MVRIGSFSRPRAVAVLAVAAALLALAIVLAAGIGTLSIPPGTTLRAIAQGTLGHAALLEGEEAIVWKLRLPRVLMGVLVGASLGTSGAAMQGLFRNPLAEPYLLGVASGASFGATLAMTLPGSSPALVPLFAFGGAVGAVVITLALSRAGGRARMTSILLAGVVVGSILTSLTMFLMLRDEDRLRAVFSWTLGNLSLSSWVTLGRATPYAASGMLLLYAFARGLDALQLGEDTARTLGVNARAVRIGVIVGASLATAAAVAFVGLIGFVGLVAPHVMRRLGAPDHRLLLPASALGGAALLVVADLGARVALRPAEIPIGVVTALLGGPFFLWLLRRQA